MLRYFFVLLISGHLVMCEDFVKDLKPKDLLPFQSPLQVKNLRPPVLLRSPVPKVCAIPLKEVHVDRNAFRIDPITPKLRLTSPKIDEGIKHAPPVPACSNW